MDESTDRPIAAPEDAFLFVRDFLGAIALTALIAAFVVWATN